jgi:hypothetical protein
MSSLADEWNNGARSITDEDDGRNVQIFVTEELLREGTVVRGFDGVWRILFENGQKKELVSIPRWRFVS